MSFVADDEYPPPAPSSTSTASTHPIATTPLTFGSMLISRTARSSHSSRRRSVAPVPVPRRSTSSPTPCRRDARPVPDAARRDEVRVRLRVAVHPHRLRRHRASRRVGGVRVSVQEPVLFGRSSERVEDFLGGDGGGERRESAVKRVWRSTTRPASPPGVPTPPPRLTARFPNTSSNTTGSPLSLHARTSTRWNSGSMRSIPPTRGARTPSRAFRRGPSDARVRVVAPRPKPRRSPRDTTPRAPSRRAPRDRTPPPAWTTRPVAVPSPSAFARVAIPPARRRADPPVASRSTAPYAAAVWVGRGTAPLVCTRASEAVP